MPFLDYDLELEAYQFNELDPQNETESNTIVSKKNATLHTEDRSLYS